MPVRRGQSRCCGPATQAAPDRAASGWPAPGRAGPPTYGTVAGICARASARRPAAPACQHRRANTGAAFQKPPPPASAARSSRNRAAAAPPQGGTREGMTRPRVTSGAKQAHAFRRAHAIRRSRVHSSSTIGASARSLAPRAATTRHRCSTVSASRFARPLATSAAGRVGPARARADMNRTRTQIPLRVKNNSRLVDADTAGRIDRPEPFHAPAPTSIRARKHFWQPSASAGVHRPTVLRGEEKICAADLTTFQCELEPVVRGSRGRPLRAISVCAA